MEDVLLQLAQLAEQAVEVFSSLQTELDRLESRVTKEEGHVRETTHPVEEVPNAKTTTSSLVRESTKKKEPKVIVAASPNVARAVKALSDPSSRKAKTTKTPRIVMVRRPDSYYESANMIQREQQADPRQVKKLPDHPKTSSGILSRIRRQYNKTLGKKTSGEQRPEQRGNKTHQLLPHQQQGNKKTVVGPPTAVKMVPLPKGKVRSQKLVPTRTAASSTGASLRAKKPVSKEEGSSGDNKSGSTTYRAKPLPVLRLPQGRNSDDKNTKICKTSKAANKVSNKRRSPPPPPPPRRPTPLPPPPRSKEPQLVGPSCSKDSEVNPDMDNRFKGTSALSQLGDTASAQPSCTYQNDTRAAKNPCAKTSEPLVEKDSLTNVRQDPVPDLGPRSSVMAQIRQNKVCLKPIQSQQSETKNFEKAKASSSLAKENNLGTNHTPSFLEGIQHGVQLKPVDRSRSVAGKENETELSGTKILPSSSLLAKLQARKEERLRQNDCTLVGDDDW